MWVPVRVVVVKIENLIVTGNRTSYSFSVSSFPSISFCSFHFPSHFLIISSSLLLCLSLVLLTRVGICASKLIQVVQNLTAQSGATSPTLVCTYFMCSIIQNFTPCIHFILMAPTLFSSRKHLECRDERHDREVTVGDWETNIILSIVLNCGPAL